MNKFLNPKIQMDVLKIIANQLNPGLLTQVEDLKDTYVVNLYPEYTEDKLVESVVLSQLVRFLDGCLEEFNSIGTDEMTGFFDNLISPDFDNDTVENRFPLLVHVQKLVDLIPYTQGPNDTSEPLFARIAHNEGSDFRLRSIKDLADMLKFEYSDYEPSIIGHPLMEIMYSGYPVHPDQNEYRGAAEGTFRDIVQYILTARYYPSHVADLAYGKDDGGDEEGFKSCVEGWDNLINLYNQMVNLTKQHFSAA